ncbi:MAG: DEAD/DEAH box helicase [Thermodesulfobacteriota bacterium]
MNITSFIKNLKERDDLGTFVHHERIEPVPPSYGVPKGDGNLPKEIEGSLRGLGIEKLYSHQARGIELVRQGRNVVVMTPTASGKSLVYNLPVLETLLKEPGSRALYLFPLKGLEQDQLKALRELSSSLPFENTAEIYDGDTTQYRRKKIRENPPSVLFTNPDMLHLGINAYHEKWQKFFSSLKFVIVDEIHTYRGVFGSHVAQVLKRLRRIAALYGSEPVFIACSATIANPGELARMLAGVEFEVIDTSGAPQGRKNFLFLNPIPELSPYTVATKLFTDSVRAGFKTIAFTKARKVTELMHAWVLEGAPDIRDKVSSYRAGFLPDERREIEGRLFSGELSGVISTSALELGVDIGGLDVCILVGYPGTVSSTWQRSGRVGRKGRDSLIVMVAMEDALDQYFMRHPKDFFRRSVEAAVLDNSNESILRAHLPCAAAEMPLRADDRVYDVPPLVPILEELETRSRVRHWQKGDVWYPRKKYPHREVSIRQAGEIYRIIEEGRGLLGESSSARVLRELHPGAIYLHRGKIYKVRKLDMGTATVFCRAADEIEYYTRAITDEETEIISVDEKRTVGSVTVNRGRLRVTETVLGYRKKHIYTREELGEVSLELPSQIFTTAGIWMEVADGLLEEAKEKGFGPGGGLHAVEHAAIATLPLFALCDRMDLGGVSYAANPQLGRAAIFIYDAHEGGIGLTKRGYEVAEEWFRTTLRMMEDCQCEISCPSCTQDPRCGNNNEPLDKRAAKLILKGWLGKDR